jgi:hypothetical protein
MNFDDAQQQQQFEEFFIHLSYFLKFHGFTNVDVEERRKTNVFMTLFHFFSRRHLIRTTQTSRTINCYLII